VSGADRSRGTPAVRIRRLPTDELTEAELAALRQLLSAAFRVDDPDEGFTEEDWQHALGGTHVVAEVGDRIIAHAAVVERELQVDGRPVRTGYVEAVAVAPASQGTGVGMAVMREAGALISAEFELGALGTGKHRFYERLGWRTWRGPSFVRTPDGLDRTADDDGYILVLETPRTPPLDPDAGISCDWRPGDVW